MLLDGANSGAGRVYEDSVGNSFLLDLGFVFSVDARADHQRTVDFPVGENPFEAVFL